MKRLLFTSLLLLPMLSFSQTGKEIWVMDFVKILNERRNEVVFYYENNWKVYRDSALAKGVIKSYKLLITKSDAASDFNLILITEYADSLQYQVREEKFQEIIKKLRPNGPTLLNEVKPADFRKSIFSKDAEILFSVD